MILTYIPVLMAIVTCGNLGYSNHVLPVYNQAYQENFEADTVADILLSARNAYVLVDSFDSNIINNIKNIKANCNQVGGYISAGTGEIWRDDFEQLKPYLTSKEWSDWPGEFYVSYTNTGIVDVMKARIDKMALLGLDWVEYDNMDWIDAQSIATFGLHTTKSASKVYINTLCDYTRQRGMKCMAKNTVDGFEHFDGVVYESHNNQKNSWDTEGAQSFIDAGKLVIINHYNESDCDGVYAEYKRFYNSDKISFICEDTNTQKYKHYN